MPKLHFSVQFLTAVFAALAAFFWLLASIDSAPDKIAAAMQAQGGMDVFGSDLAKLISALTHQAELNTRAAACAACAAGLGSSSGTRCDA
jgi:hypothetical protein